MRDKKDNFAYIKSVRDAIEKISTYVNKHKYEEFFSNDWDQAAIIRYFEIIGEAVSNINEEFKKTVLNLKEAGFPPDKIGVYILIGLPGQKPEELEETIRFVLETGAKPILAEYSPIPQTALWGDAVEESRFDIAREPLFHNNSLVPFRSKHFSLETYSQLKQMARQAG